MKRVTAAIDRVTSEHSGSHIVAVAHGGTIRAALGHALGLPPPLALSFAVDNCSLTRVDHVVAGGDVHWHIVTVNDNLGRGVTFSARL
ncbi:MAG: histidine phosphatase family protein, partial [Alphaproteobacteria bacterium]